MKELESGLTLQRRRKFKNTSSKYRGVSYHQLNKSWQSRVTKDGVTYSLGSFTNEEDAAKAYNEKAKELYGRDARLNHFVKKEGQL